MAGSPYRIAPERPRERMCTVEVWIVLAVIALMLAGFAFGIWRALVRAGLLRQ